MLQFSATLCAAIVKTIPKSSWRIPHRLSSVPITHEQVASTEKSATKSVGESNNESERVDDTTNIANNKSSPEHTTRKPALTSIQLKNAKTADDFLNIVQNYQLSQQDTFKIMSNMMRLIHGGEIKIEDMLTDSRFEMLQQSIAATDTDSYKDQSSEIGTKYGSLSTVEMIKVLGNMVRAGEKNIDIMKFLSEQILQFNAQLSPVNCKSLLSYMVTMKFQHKVLTNKICRQLIANSSQLSFDVVHEVVTSLGLLRYKDNLLFDVMCTYMLYYKKELRPNDLSSVVLTFGTLGYSTPKVESLIKKHIYPLKCTDFANSRKWFLLVWSLAVLNMAEKHHYKSVLSKEFLQTIQRSGKWSVSDQLKLLNIKAAASIVDGLDEIYVGGIGNANITIMPYRKALVTTLDETLKVVLPSKSHYKTSINTEMGFFIDAECYTNSEGQFQTADSPDIEKRLAILLITLAEYTRGEGDLVGIVHFQKRLLEAKGYTVVQISEKYFSPVDTEVKRMICVKDEIRKAINLPK